MRKRSVVACSMAITCWVLAVQAQTSQPQPAQQGQVSPRPPSAPPTPVTAQPAAARAASATPASPVISAADQRAFLNQYCIACHSERAKAAGMDWLQACARRLDTANLHRDAQTEDRRELRAA
jgi:hypothetical protein